MANAISALRGNGLRSILTTLGISIGVGSVVLLVAIGQGVQRQISGELNTLGSNLAMVLPGTPDANGMPNMAALAAISTLTLDDERSIEALPGVQESSPIMFIAGGVDRKRVSYPAIVVGCAARIRRIRNVPIIEGRAMTERDNYARVCVVADEVRKSVFGAEPAVGQKLSVRGVEYQVIGVLGPEPKSMLGSGGFSFQTVIYTPLLEAQRTFPGGQVNRIAVKFSYDRPPSQSIADLKRTLIKNHGGREDFCTITQEQAAGMFYRLLALATALLAGISAISLAVAGIGVMNIMLVTVTERTREIGVRKCVGARTTDIFVQFLTEAITLCLMGGVAGFTIAMIVCAVMSSHSMLKPVITPAAVAMAFGVCMGMGVLFGVAPAMRAARLNPIDALRWE